MKPATVGCILSLFVVSACEKPPQGVTADPVAPSFALTGGGDEPIDRIISMVNSHLEEQGAPYRLGGIWMFTIGVGRPANRILQRGTRWVPGDPRRAAWSTGTEDVTYVVDVSDLTKDLKKGKKGRAAVEAAVDASFSTWSGVHNTFLDVVKLGDDRLNHDFLDNIPADPSLCTFPGILDFTALPPNADIIVGGWLSREYFDCLTPDGGAFILGATWTFIFVGPAGPTDINNDGYIDTALKEIYYNEAFTWVTSGSVFLGDLIDIKSVSVHENGHAVDLGHFGGPPPPLKLHPDERVFSPEAVMNPAYLGGEKRELFPTDESGFRTLWSDGEGRVD